MSLAASQQNGGRRLELLSVVAPVYNEEATIEEFYGRVCGALTDMHFELVLVDDGSNDRTQQPSSVWLPPTREYVLSSCRETSATRPPSPRGSTMPAVTRS